MYSWPEALSLVLENLSEHSGVGNESAAWARKHEPGYINDEADA